MTEHVFKITKRTVLMSYLTNEKHSMCLTEFADGINYILEGLHAQ